MKIRRVLLCALAGLIPLACLLIYIYWDLPTLASLPQQLNVPSIRITDRNGRLLYEILPRQGGRNAALAVEDIPQCMKDATVAVEDKSFYHNPGVDLEGILRAVWIDLRGGQVVAGGGTITQQVARNLLLRQNDRTHAS